MTLAHVMGEEIEAKDEAEATHFKNLLFAHAFANDNTKLFSTLYPDEFGLSEEDEERMEWDRPESQDDIEDMLADLREVGFGGSSEPSSRHAAGDTVAWAPQRVSRNA